MLKPLRREFWQMDYSRQNESMKDRWHDRWRVIEETKPRAGGHASVRYVAALDGGAQRRPQDAE